RELFHKIKHGLHSGQCACSRTLSELAPAIWLGIWCDRLLARSLGRVMVGNQPPAPLLLYPDPGKASVTGNSFAFILPNHCRAAGLHSRVSIDAHLNVIGGDRLKFQITRREI